MWWKVNFLKLFFKFFNVQLLLEKVVMEKYFLVKKILIRLFFLKKFILYGKHFSEVVKELKYHIIC
jgi:hypothetical protein